MCVSVTIWVAELTVYVLVLPASLQCLIDLKTNRLHLETGSGVESVPFLGENVSGRCLLMEQMRNRQRVSLDGAGALPLSTLILHPIFQFSILTEV